MCANGFTCFYQAGLEKFGLIFCLELRKNLKDLRFGYKIKRFDNNKAKEMLQMETKVCWDVTKICASGLFFGPFREFETTPTPVL